MDPSLHPGATPVLDPDVRNGVVTVLRKLAEAADVRFRAGGAACCSVEPGERC